MKKMLSLAVAVSIYAIGFSQADAGSGKTFSIGPSVGFGHAAITNTTGTNMFKAAESVGLIFNYSTSEHIGFAGDVLWSSEGSRVDRDGIETDITMQYIRVPLKFAYFFGQFEDTFRPKLTIGPSMGFLLDAQRDIEGMPTNDVTAGYRTFDIGGNASAGFNLKLAPNIWMNTDLNYYYGFRPIRTDQHNTNLGLKVGVAFGL